MNALATAQVAADPFFPRLKKLVIESTGMAFYLDKDDDLARILHARLVERGVESCAQYLEVLEAPRGNDEMDLLVAELTIGETYFFRHKEQFDALRDIILPEVIERNQSSRRLRIWSAGCSIGPEPYSLAILLKREFGVRIAGWNVQIVATDINQKFLTRAREGRYDEWAFRVTGDELREDCFVKVGRQWEIRPEFKRQVSFQYHNLIKDRFPSVADNITSFDVIICRNVIIYFSRETIEGLIPCFREALVENGWLVMGHAEPNQELFRDYRTVNTAGAVLYQKAVPQCPTPLVQSPVHRAPLPPIRSPLMSSPPPAPLLRPRVPVAPVPVVKPLPPKGTAGLNVVRELADRGEWVQAAAACDELLKHDALDARLHFYRAMIHEQSGEVDAAEQALKRAIYLDRKFVLPHYHLGLFYLRRQDVGGAVRCFRNALALLEGLPEHQTVLDGDDGLTVGHLRDTAAMHLKLMGAA
jgi:chemotaxis protein methyltransferase CheR